MSHLLSPEALAVLACPRCQGSLEQADSLSCSRCGSTYPWLGALPCLVPEPSRWRAQAAQQLGEYLEFSAGRLAELELEQQAPRLLAHTAEIEPQATARARVNPSDRFTVGLHYLHGLSPARDLRWGVGGCRRV
jgi:uncharacterized protein YbaR (Trm112 family)